MIRTFWYEGSGAHGDERLAWRQVEAASMARAEQQALAARKAAAAATAAALQEAGTPIYDQLVAEQPYDSLAIED